MDVSVRKERVMVFERLAHQEVVNLGLMLADMIKTKKLRAGVEVFFNNMVVFRYLAPDCYPDHEHWLLKKRNTVMMFHMSTLDMSQKCNNDASLLERKYGLKGSDYTLVAGGIPLMVRNMGCVGAICVTGLKPEEDHQLIADTLKNMLK